MGNVQVRWSSLYACLLYTPDYFRYKEFFFFYCTRQTTSVISKFYFTHPSTSVTKYAAPQIKQNISERICVDTATRSVTHGVWEGCSRFVEPGASVPRYGDHKHQSSSALSLEAAIKPFPLIGWGDIHLVFWLASPFLISYLSCHRSFARQIYVVCCHIALRLRF